MSTTRCPECGATLPSDAPRGLCPNCLLNAGVAAGGDSLPREQFSELDSIFPELSEPVAVKRDLAAEQAALVPLSEFRQTVVELGIMDAGDFDRTAAAFASDVEGLARSLSRSGLVTVYQAAAIRQGKARGLIVGDYLILDKVGQGGMGVVFKARHRRHGLIVALKILPPRLARDRKLVLRFRREIHAAALLDHPNIVAALDADEDRGVHYLTMEYIEGIDLHGFVKNGGALPARQAVEYMIQAARGLAAAHARGIIHRDIKPGNLMLDAMGTLRVLDLGLALIKEDEAAQSAQAAAMTLTQAGAYMGTVDFMAPEQAQNSHTVDHRADIYSLACTLHFLLTVRPPFEGPTPLSRLIAHQHTPAPSLRDKRPDVPEPLDALYQAMMAKRPEDRPSSMTEVVARLEGCLLPAAQTSVAAGVLMTLPGPLRNGDSSASVVAGEVDSRDSSRVAEVVPESNFGGSVTEYGPVESTASLIALGASGSKASGHGDATTWRGLAFLLAFSGLAALTAIGTLSAISRRDRDARGLRDRPGTGLTTKAPIEPADRDVLDADPQAAETAESESGSIASKAAPAPKQNQGDGPAMAASSTSRRVLPVDRSRTVKKQPAPAPSPAPSVAAAAAPRTYDCLPCFRGHKGAAVTTVVVSQDGRLALSAGADHYARLWNIKTGAEISAARHPSDVLDAAISPDGRFAFTCTKGATKKNGAVRFWNMNMPTKALFTSERAHVGPINAVALFPDGRALSGGRDGQVVLWNLNARRPLAVLGEHKGPIHSHGIAFFPHGAVAATGGQDRLVHIWNLQRGKEVGTWTGHQGAISSIAIATNGKRVATGSSDGTVILWDRASGSVIRSFPMPDGDRGARVAILPDGNVLAAGNVVGHLVLWDAKSGRVLRQSKGPFVKHGGLAVLPDGERVLTADSDGIVRMWTPRPQ